MQTLRDTHERSRVAAGPAPLPSAKHPSCCLAATHCVSDWEMGKIQEWIERHWPEFQQLRHLMTGERGGAANQTVWEWAQGLSADEKRG